jgi:hypothetical protein
MSSPITVAPPPPGLGLPGRRTTVHAATRTPNRIIHRRQRTTTPHNHPRRTP